MLTETESDTIKGFLLNTGGKHWSICWEEAEADEFNFIAEIPKYVIGIKVTVTGLYIQGEIVSISCEATHVTPGDRVIETQMTCQQGDEGVVYRCERDGPTKGSLCVAWRGGMSTSVTGGTFPIRDVDAPKLQELREISAKRRAYASQTKDCPECDGEGFLYGETDEGRPKMKDCPTCRKMGRVPL